MTLTTNEVRKRLARFAKTFEDAHYEKGQAAIFLTRFYECFGIAPETATLFEQFTSRIAGGHGFIDNFIPGKLSVELNSRGKDAQKIVLYGQSVLVRYDLRGWRINKLQYNK